MHIIELSTKPVPESSHTPSVYGRRGRALAQRMATKGVINLAAKI